MCEQPLTTVWLEADARTRQAGAILARTLAPLAASEPVIVFVRGDLGAGKSTLVRGLLTELGITGVMPSPTYTLVEPYRAGGLRVFHMDAYRLADPAELDFLGLEAIGDAGTLLFVEWPDHVKEALPEPTVTVDLSLAPAPGAARGGTSGLDGDGLPVTGRQLDLKVSAEYSSLREQLGAAVTWSPLADPIPEKWVVST